MFGLQARHMWLPPAAAAAIGTPTEVPAASLFEAIMALGPSLFWVLGDSGGLTDRSGNGRDGTAGGGVTIGGGPSLNTDRSGSTDFNAADDRVTSGYAPFATGSTRTFIGTISPDLAPASGTVWRGAGANGPKFTWTFDAIHAVYKVTFDPLVGGGAAVEWVVPDDGGVPVGMWALVFNEAGSTGNATLYWNGVNLGAKDVSDNYSSPGNFQVGDSTGSMNAHESHVAIFEAGLTASQIAYLAALADVLPVIFRRKADDSTVLWPRFELEQLPGLFGSGESGDSRDNRVGAQGEIPRRSKRRGKSIPYTGMIKGKNPTDLETSAQILVDAFDDQDSEGMMIVYPHSTYAAANGLVGQFRYFSAKALTADVIDQLASPFLPSHGHEWPFVASVRNARAFGVSYRDQDGVEYK